MSSYINDSELATASGGTLSFSGFTVQKAGLDGTYQIIFDPNTFVGAPVITVSSADFSGPMQAVVGTPINSNGQWVASVTTYNPLTFLRKNSNFSFIAVEPSASPS